MNTKKSRTPFLAVISMALLVSFSACNNLVQPKIPSLKGYTGGKSVVTDVKVTGIKYQVGDYNADARFTSFTDAPTAVYYTQTLENDTYGYTIQIIVDGDISTVLYEVQDVVMHTITEKMTTMGGFIPVDLSLASEVNVYIHTGKKTYTVHLEKQNPERCIYVSALGNGTQNDNDEDDQRGYAPETAYYSLSNAIAKMKRVSFNTVAIIGTLSSDHRGDADSTFVIDEQGLEHAFVIKGFTKSGYTDPPTLTMANSSGKRILSISTKLNVTIIGLAFSGARTTQNGAAIYMKTVNGNSPRVTLRGVTITDNETTGSGGGVYTDEGTSLTLAPGTKVFGNKVGIGSGKGSGVYHKGAYFAMEGLSYIGTGAPERMTIDSIDTVPDTLFLAAATGATVHPISVSTKILPRSEGNDPGIAAFVEVPAAVIQEGTVILQDVQDGSVHGIDAADTTLKNYMRFKMVGAPSTNKLWRIDAAGKLASASAYYVGSRTVEAVGGESEAGGAGDESSGSGDLAEAADDADAGLAGVASDVNDGLSADTPFLTLEQALYAAASTSVCKKIIVQTELGLENHNATISAGDYLHLERSANTGADSATFNIGFYPLMEQESAITIVGFNTAATDAGTVSSLSINASDVYFNFDGIKIFDSVFSGKSVLSGSSGEHPVWFANTTLQDKTSIAYTVFGDIHIGGAADEIKMLDNFVVKAAAGGNASVQGINITAGSCDFRGKAVRMVINGENASVTNKDAMTDTACSEVWIEKGLFEMGRSLEGKIYKKRFGDLTWISKDAYLAGNAPGEGTLYFEPPVGIIDSASSTVMQPLEFETWRANYKAANYGAEPRTSHTWYGRTADERPIRLDFAGTPGVRLIKRIVVPGAKYARGTTLFTGSGATETVIVDKMPAPMNYNDNDSYEWVVGAESGKVGVMGRNFDVGDVLNYDLTYEKNGDSRGVQTFRKSYIYKVFEGDAYKAMFWGYLKDSDDPKDMHKYEDDDDVNIFGLSFTPSGVKGKLYDGHWTLPSETEGTDQEIVDAWSGLKEELGGNGNMAGGLIDGHEAFFITATLGRNLTIAVTASTFGVLAVASAILIIVALLNPAAVTIGITGLIALCIGGTVIIGGVISTAMWAYVDSDSNYDFMRLVTPADYTTDGNYKYTYLPDNGNVILVNSFANFVEFEHDPVYTDY